LRSLSSQPSQLSQPTKLASPRLQSSASQRRWEMATAYRGFKPLKRFETWSILWGQLHDIKYTPLYTIILSFADTKYIEVWIGLTFDHVSQKYMWTDGTIMDICDPVSRLWVEMIDTRGSTGIDCYSAVYWTTYSRWVIYQQHCSTFLPATVCQCKPKDTQWSFQSTDSRYPLVTTEKEEERKRYALSSAGRH
jgi:hypothetical protein